MTTTLPWGPHLRGLNNVNTVGTYEVDETRIRMLETSRARSIMLVTGPVGAGKSHATARAAEACADNAQLAAEIVWVELARSTSERDLLTDLTVQVTNVTPPAKAPLREIRNDLTVALSERHRVLIVDEAQHMSSQRLLVLRWLHDFPEADFALVLVGTPELQSQLAPEIQSRCARRVQFEPIADSEIVGTLHRYDPAFAAVAPKFLQRINREHAQGRWRWWAQFLWTARQYASVAGTDFGDDQVLAAAIEAVT